MCSTETMLKDLSLRVGLAVFGIILALMVMEVYFRLTGVTGYQDVLSIYEFDDVIGWKTKESSRTFRSTRNFAHFNYFNPQGFPVDKDNWEKSLDTEMPSIAFIGDSFTEGFYLPYEQGFPYLVDQKFPGKQVVNLGVTGYAPDQYLLAARKHLSDYHITDVVVMFFAFNDVPDVSNETSNGYAKPVFGNSFDEPENLPLKILKGEGRRGILRKLNDRSALARALNPFMFEYIPGLMGVSAPAFGANYDDEIAMRKALRLIKQIKVEFPVERFLVYYIPLLEETLNEEVLEHNVKLYEALCSELGLECHTPDVLLTKVADPADLFIPVNRHFSELGARLVSEELYEILSSD